ncbi:MAG TPA: diguanylate cyclase [Blastocatellia bacterium]|nr:diguanylate cyclase [Blastocatellia bacterium]
MTGTADMFRSSIPVPSALAGEDDCLIKAVGGLLSSEGANRGFAYPDDGPAVRSIDSWLQVQSVLAERTGLTLLTFGRDGGPIGAIENNSSICEAMSGSPEHAALCQLDCGRAHSQALSEGERVKFRCHAGLQCFCLPSKAGDLEIAVLGGRSFNSVTAYQDFLRRYSDLKGVQSGEALQNVKFHDAREFELALDLVASSVENHRPSASRTIHKAGLNGPKRLLDAHLEIIRLTDELESKNHALSRLYEFLHDVSSVSDGKHDYTWVLNKLGSLLSAERGSLMIFDEGTGELAVEAAVGFDPPPTRVKLGDPIAGAVLASGSPMLVRDIDTEPGIQPLRPESYKSKSFISFPIALGARKIGVINLTGRTNGIPYAIEDLSLVELMAPHLAMMIDRGEWHKKADAFQQMSLTDPLTGLPNRRYLEERLFEEVERSKRHGTPLSFMIIDVDHFKSYNDLYGHTSADHVLIRTAQSLRHSIRTIDMSARFAGDEFCIILPETDLSAAAIIAERLRGEVSQTEYVSDDGKSMGRITISIGVSGYSRRQNAPRSIIEAADRGLYQAKTKGRNCVVVYQDGSTPRPEPNLRHTSFNQAGSA